MRDKGNIAQRMGDRKLDYSQGVMKQLHDEVIPSGTVVHEVVKQEIFGHVQLIKPFLHRRGNDAKNGEVARPGRSLVKTFLYRAQMKYWI